MPLSGSRHSVVRITYAGTVGWDVASMLIEADARPATGPITEADEADDSVVRGLLLGLAIVLPLDAALLGAVWLLT